MGGKSGHPLAAVHERKQRDALIGFERARADRDARCESISFFVRPA
jgi:hypothetical protein